MLEKHFIKQWLINQGFSRSNSNGVKKILKKLKINNIKMAGR